MASYWIVKTEPSTYSYGDLERQKKAVWDGVKNNLALKHLRQMNPGDRVLVYHTGDEKAVVGVAEVTSEAYPDPKQKDPKLAVVDLRAVGRLPRPVPLAEIKKDRAFADLALVRIGRLSVMPASAEQFRRLEKLGGMK
ncbi:MAG: EVE domain-containing protein [Gemmatimonadetes bacterium]|nr:MAG: EVE domain-containing protein [Gemmatimonadota bacterium]